MSGAGVINRKNLFAKIYNSRSYIKEKQNFCHKCLINNVGRHETTKIINKFKKKTLEAKALPIGAQNSQNSGNQLKPQKSSSLDYNYDQ